ncbi:unnamed protein product [Victoria cruziana]
MALEDRSNYTCSPVLFFSFNELLILEEQELIRPHRVPIAPSINSANFLHVTFVQFKQQYSPNSHSICNCLLKLNELGKETSRQR